MTCAQLSEREGAALHRWKHSRASMQSAAQMLPHCWRAFTDHHVSALAECMQALKTESSFVAPNVVPDCFTPCFCSSWCCARAGYVPALHLHCSANVLGLNVFTASNTTDTRQSQLLHTGEYTPCQCERVLQRQLRSTSRTSCGDVCSTPRDHTHMLQCVDISPGDFSDAATLPSSEELGTWMEQMLREWKEHDRPRPDFETLLALMLHPGFNNTQALQNPGHMPQRLANVITNMLGLQGVTSIGCGDGLLEELLAHKLGPLNVAGWDSHELHPLARHILHGRLRPDTHNLPIVHPQHMLLFAFAVHKIPWVQYAKQHHVRAVGILGADEASQPHGKRKSDINKLHQLGFTQVYEEELKRAGGAAHLSVWCKAAQARQRQTQQQGGKNMEKGVDGTKSHKGGRSTQSSSSKKEPGKKHKAR